MKKYILKVYDALFIRIKANMIRKNVKLNIMSSSETIDYIKKERCSISRFGDGEFDLMLQKGGPDFQQGSERIRLELLNIFEEPSNNLLICIPYGFVSYKGFTKGARKFWNWWMIHKYIDIEKMINTTGCKCIRFGDSYVSRPYTAYKSYNYTKTIFNKLKELWYDRSILIIEGEETRLGVGNNLFDNTKSIRRILAPSTNAFEKYELIKGTILSNWNNELVILALGPTATILANDLSKNGIQALDLGHIDIQYEWYLRKDKSFSSVKGKYVENTIKKDGKVEACNDWDYINSIVANVCK